MQFIAEKPHAPRFEFNRPEIQAFDNVGYSGRQQPTVEAFENFVFEVPVIPLEGGRYSIRLSKPLILKMNFDTMKFKVVDWNIEMYYSELQHLPREAARRFLHLFHSAELDMLTEAEQADWLRMLDYVDFKQFSIDRSSPRYVTGILLRRSDFVFVEWHDGTRERLDHNVALALNEVNDNEKFSAFVKIGKNDKTEAIERISLVGDSDNAKDWESWPKKG